MRAMLAALPLLLSFSTNGLAGTTSMNDSTCIVFFGDSITQLGVKPDGYVSLIRDSLLRTHPAVRIVGAGISGNKVPDLEERLDRDVLPFKPAVVVIYIGINDVWHAVTPGLHGTPIDRYEAGLRSLAARIAASGARIIFCTPTVIGEKPDGSNPLDGKLDEYAGVTRRVAADTHSTLCDLRNIFFSYLKTHNPKNDEKGILTVDTVHLTAEGNKLVAESLLGVLN